MELTARIPPLHRKSCRSPLLRLLTYLLKNRKSQQSPPPQKTQTEPKPAPSADPYAQALEQMDLPALQQVNSDVIGWIAIPGTEISYPLVQDTDNDYYLTHTWNQNSSAVGAIFMDCRCSADFSGFNTIVYGHRMNNGSMFAALKHYKSRISCRHIRRYM